MRKATSPEKIQEIIQKALDLILKEDHGHKIKAILLFGSQANNTSIWRSDLDFCVVFNEDPTFLEAGLFRKRLMGLLPEVVDLQVFNVLPLKIKKSIADNHLILFQSKDFNEDDFIISTHKLFFELQNRKALAEAV